MLRSILIHIRRCAAVAALALSGHYDFRLSARHRPTLFVALPLQMALIAVVGWVVGVTVGVLLALAMQRLRVVERAVLPLVVLSQTVPLIALAYVPVVACRRAPNSAAGCRKWR